MPLVEKEKLIVREMLPNEKEIVLDMLQEGSREWENRLLLHTLTRPASLLLIAVASSTARFALGSLAASLLLPPLCLAALLKLGLRMRRGFRGLPPGPLWVAVHDGEDVCGCLAFGPRAPPPPVAQLRALAVGAWHRRAGVGSLLLAAFERGAREAGHRRAVVWLEPVNVPARALFEKHGYRPTGGASVLPGFSLEYAKDL